MSLIRNSLRKTINQSINQCRVSPSISRSFHTSTSRLVETSIPLKFRVNGKDREVSADLYLSLLSAAQDGRIDQLEGICGGGCACSTCHVILEQAVYDKLGAPTDEEQDLLDAAPGVCDTSRLACQVSVEPFMKGTTIIVPDEFKNQEKF